MAVKPTTNAQRRTLVQDALRIIDAEYATDLRLDEVARRIATSRRQLQRSFREVNGGGFRDALTRRRMLEAGRMLAEGPIRVRDVARAVGYSQPAQFAKAFRAFHGHPPRAHRERAGSAAKNEAISADASTGPPGDP
jgi:AraC family transcriptional regulator, regulatory protein of adaptative response / methylphosphotriester-DNA alkyltransferase methyltransferase